MASELWVMPVVTAWTGRSPSPRLGAGEEGRALAGPIPVARGEPPAVLA